jgi:hypothetical protein
MTTRTCSTTCAAIALGLTVGLVAQEPPTAQPSQSAAAKTITVSGCVQRAQAAPTATSGAAGAASTATETRFILTNAAINTTGATGTSGTTNPPATAVASEYRLDADDAKLMPHVGHKVEITGTAEQASRTTPPAASAANAPKLKVDEVKMVGATCP